MWEVEAREERGEGKQQQQEKNCNSRKKKQSTTLLDPFKDYTIEMTCSI